LTNDPQLRLYHYAMSYLYPDYDVIIPSVYFINKVDKIDGGVFSIPFTKLDIAKTEDMIKKRFRAIKYNKNPRLTKTWKCKRLCHFGKQTFEGTHIQPEIEYRDGQFTKPGKIMTQCQQIHNNVQQHGMLHTIEKYKWPGHNFSHYEDPGA